MAGKRNYNSKHLRKGDALPPFSGKLRVFNMRYCPDVQRTILALNAKNIDYEIVNVDLKDKPEWLTSVSPFGTVPALEISEGVCLTNDLVTVEYLEDVYPQRPLLPKDPLLKAKDKDLVQAWGPVISLQFKLVKGLSDTITKNDIAAYYKSFDLLQTQLKQRGTKFLDGEQPGYADYMLWPWFERLLVLKTDVGRLDEKQYKLVLEYIENLAKDPVIAEYMLPTEALQAFVTASNLHQKPNYDLLLDQ